MTPAFDDERNWIKEDRIYSTALESALYLESGERVLTWADFLFAWREGTIFLTDRRIAWLRWKQLLNILKGPSSVEIRLGNVQACRTFRAWSPYWPYFRAGLEVAVKDANPYRFVPRHSGVDTRTWSTAISDLAGLTH